MIPVLAAEDFPAVWLLLNVAVHRYVYDLARRLDGDAHSFVFSTTPPPSIPDRRFWAMHPQDAYFSLPDSSSFMLFLLEDAFRRGVLPYTLHK